MPIDGVGYDFPAGYGGKLDRRFWCSFAWDDDEKRVLFYEGYLGDHGQAAGSIYANTLYSFTPGDHTVHLLHLTESWSNAAYDVFTTEGAPVEPHPRHTYAGFHYAAGRKTVYLVSGACAHDTANCTTPDAWQYDVAKGAWKAVAGALPDASFGGYGGSLVGLPGDDTLWYFSPRRDGSGWVNIYALDMNTEQWSAKIKYGSDVSALVRAVADPARHRVLVWVGGGSKLLSFDPDTKAMTPVAAVPEGFPADGTVAYIAKHDVFFFYQPKEGAIWTYAPATGAFAQVPHEADPKARVDNYMAYDPVLDRVVTYTIDGGFWQFHYEP